MFQEIVGVGPPPPGVTPNFKNPENHTYVCLNCSYLVTVVYRIYHCLKREIGNSLVVVFERGNSGHEQWQRQDL
jgi:hypothetical protein